MNYNFIYMLGFIIISAYITLAYKKKHGKVTEMVFFIILPCIFMIAAIYILGYYILVVNNTLLNSKNDSFIGSFTGGVLGGIIALLIAKYQIGWQNKEKLNLEKKESSGYIISLSTELRNNLELISKISNSEFENAITISRAVPLSIKTWDAVKLSSVFINKISIDFYRELSEYYYEMEIFKNGNLNINSSVIENMLLKGNEYISRLQKLQGD